MNVLGSTTGTNPGNEREDGEDTGAKLKPRKKEFLMES